MSTKPRKSGGTPRDNDAAARALADWARRGFTRATSIPVAESAKVTTRTLYNWKAALDKDEELSALFRDRINDHLNSDWAAQLDEAIRVSITRMLDLIRTSVHLTEVTEAFTALSEVALTREVLHGAANANTQPPAGSAAETRTNNAAFN